MPNSVTYLTDALTLLLLFQLFIYGRKVALRVNLGKPLLCLAFFSFAVVLSFFVNLLDGSMQFVFFLWGLRIYYRMFIFFAACILFLRETDVENLLRYLIALVPVNALLCVYFVFVKGYSQDRIGGLFGSTKGCDGMMCLYLLIVCATCTVWHINGKLSAAKTIIILALALSITALGELKMLFFAIPALILGAVFFLPNRRSLRLLLICGILLTVAIPLFLVLYPEYVGFFTTDSIRFYTSEMSYGEAGSINRLSGMGYLLRELLTSFPEKLFGVGLGNADIFLNFASNFYARHYSIRYNWFMHTFLLAEVGLLGLLAYVSFFVAILWDSWRSEKLLGPGKNSLPLIGLLLSAASLLLLIYNTSYHTTAAYFAFFVMAFPYIAQKEYNLNKIRAKEVARTLAPLSSKA